MFSSPDDRSEKCMHVVPLCHGDVKSLREPRYTTSAIGRTCGRY